MKLVGGIFLGLKFVSIMMSMLSSEYHYLTMDKIYLDFNGYYFYPILLLAILYWYFKITMLMKKLHKYEFERTKNSM
jgi:hypothetical protein